MSQSKTAMEFLSEGLISRCGINCRFCPSYRDHIKTDADKQRCSDIWFKFLGFRVEPATIRPCDGCATSVYYGVDGADAPDCAIRACATANGVQTCAHCSAYRAGCFLHHGAQAGTAEPGRPPVAATTRDERPFFGDLGRKQGNRSPEENLADIRASLAPEDIVHVTPPAWP